MNENQKFKQLYASVENSVAQALLDVSEIRLKSAAGNQHLQGLKSELDQIQKKFKGEINQLEEFSEWEKFTIAFFGETNAGKSTIIESMRILFDEKGRSAAAEQNRTALADLEASQVQEIDALLLSLNDSYVHYEQEVSTITAKLAELAAISRHEHRISRKAMLFALALALGFAVGFGACHLFGAAVKPGTSPTASSAWGHHA